MDGLILSDRIKKIVIVGGGTAGWVTAGLIAAKFQGLPKDDSLEVVLVESPNIPTIGVGEGTWPTMRGTLKEMGIRETDFIRECDATFKQGAKFARWVTGESSDAYYHPLVLPQGFLHANLANEWLSDKNGEAFAHAVSAQGAVCDQGLSPKSITTPEYEGVLNYAYHLDAGKFSSFIQKHAVDNLAVEHIYADVDQVHLDEHGYVSSIETQQAGKIEGDIFVDCTGFRSLLLGEAMGVEFVDRSGVLFADNALAVQCPYTDEHDGIASHTISTAQDAGWIWDIGLPTRRGIGHVYSSNHTTKDKAEKQLLDYVVQTGGKVDDLSIRHLPIRSGHRKQFWKKNVVAVGLAAGFLEPLEASAIVLVEMSAQLICDQMPVNRSAMKIVERRFNQVFHYRWARIVDFLKLHYCISKRNDSQFWLDNQSAETIPDSLKELLELWQYQSPWINDFQHKDEVFPAASYQYILYGMGFETMRSFHGQTVSEVDMSRRQLKANAVNTQRLLRSLPKNRDLIDKIVRYGLQKI